MAHAYKCDACSRLVDGKVDVRIERTPVNIPAHAVKLELCVDCVESFDAWRHSRGAHMDAAPEQPGGVW